MTGCSSSSAPTRVARIGAHAADQALAGDDRALDAEPHEPPVEAHGAAVAGAVAARHRRLERDLAGHAGDRAGRGDGAHEAVGPGREHARGAPPAARASSVEHVGGRERDLALGGRHELGGARRVGVAERREQHRRRAGAARAARSSATPKPPPTSSGAGPAAAASKPRPNGPSTSTSAPTRASAASAGPRGWQQERDARRRPRRRPRAAAPGTPSCASARSMWNWPGLARRERALDAHLDVRPERLARPPRACSVKRAAPAGSSARPARRARSPAPPRWRPASVVMQGTLAEIAARRIW